MEEVGESSTSVKAPVNTHKEKAAASRLVVVSVN